MARHDNQAPPPATGPGRRRRLLGLAGLLSLGCAGVLGAEVIEYFNLFSNTPRVRLVRGERTIHAPDDSDEPFRVISDLSGAVVLEPSALLDPVRSFISNMPPSGFIKRLFPGIRTIARVELAHRRRGLNRASLRFNPPLDVPLWAESLEFWSHGDGRTHRFRLAYRDEAGVHYHLEFQARAYRGWQRFAATIPQRIQFDRPFAERYRRLQVVSLIVLDSGPGSGRPRRAPGTADQPPGGISRYHFASLGAARIRRTLENEREWWAFRRVYGFERLEIPALDVRFYGMTNQRLESLANPAGRDGGEDGYLALSAGLVRGGPRRVILRFPAPIRTGVCRMLVLTVHGNSGQERILLLARNFENRHFLFDLGRIGFDGPHKLYLRVPDAVVQGTRNIAAEKGLFLLELLIEPEATARGELRLGLDNLSVVEDAGEYLFEGVELLDQWGMP